MLVDLKAILKDADEKHYAVPAINVYNMETVMGVIQAAEETKSPIILQGYSRLFTDGNAYYLAPIVLAAAKKASVPVCFHLDHGASEVETTRALRYGCTGVMIDASALDLDENIKLTKRVVDTCKYAGVSVEGELGHIGTTKDETMDEFTIPSEAKEYVEKTGVAALAVLVGTAHGRYKKPPKLDIQRIADIKDVAGVPLVLHGGSGVPDDQIVESIKAGICKINFSTNMCYTFIDEIFETSRDLIAIDMFMKEPINSVRKFTLSKIELLGSKGRA